MENLTNEVYKDPVGGMVDGDIVKVGKDLQQS